MNVELATVLLFTSTPHAQGNSVFVRLPLADHTHVRNFRDFAFANAVVERFVACVEVRANARILHPFHECFGGRHEIERDRNDAHLFGRQPNRKRAPEVFNQDRNKTFERPTDGTMYHNGTMCAVVLPGVIEIKPLGRVVIQLNGAQLPRPSNGVRDIKVDFRAVKTHRRLLSSHTPCRCRPAPHAARLPHDPTGRHPRSAARAAWQISAWRSGQTFRSNSG